MWLSSINYDRFFIIVGETTPLRLWTNRIRTLCTLGITRIMLRLHVIASNIAIGLWLMVWTSSSPVLGRSVRKTLF